MLLLGALVLLLLLPAGSAIAQGPVEGSDGGQVFTQQDVSLEAGETFKGDLSVIDGNLSMAEGSSVLGDVFVTKGNASIAGDVSGNATVVGGRVSLADSGKINGDLFILGGKHDLAGQVKGDVSILFGETVLRNSAVIRGDLLAVPGDLTREEGSQVNGQVVTRFGAASSESLEEEPGQLPEATVVVPPTPLSPRPTPPVDTLPPWTERHDFGDRLARFAGRLLSALLFTLLVIGVGVLIVLVWPRQTRRVDECIATLPGQSLGLGLLTFLLAAGLEVVAVFVMVLVILAGALLMATIILIPVGLLLILLSGLVLLPVPLALAGGVLLGWVGLAEIIGRKLLDGLHARGASQLAHVLLGLLVTLVPAVVLWLIQPWCCGLPFVIILTSIGLGAVFHTRFGTRACQRETPFLEPERLPKQALAEPTPERVAVEHNPLPADAMEEEVGAPDVSPLPPPPPPPANQ